jgi:DNA-binding XRE family transcriptional regulator
LLYFSGVGVLEIIAERRIGREVFRSHPGLLPALEAAENAARRSRASEEDKARIAAIIELCFEYDQEQDPDEKENILRTLAEISSNKPLELPTETADQWDKSLKAQNVPYAKESRQAEARIQAFLKKYFSLRAKAGLQTQSAVAKASGLKRSYIALIETGEHLPQQKTLQKLAKALGVDISELLP